LKWFEQELIFVQRRCQQLRGARHRADKITATTQAALDARDVIKRAQNNGG
jgi:hypothetical protein